MGYEEETKIEEEPKQAPSPNSGKGLIKSPSFVAFTKPIQVSAVKTEAGVKVTYADGASVALSHEAFNENFTVA